MSPRSILKRSVDSPSIHSSTPQSATYYNSALPYPPHPPHVHFPPTSALTQTFTTHSGAAYDRAPIVVLKNDCELPERGCPGRTYDSGSRAKSSCRSSSSRRDCRSSRTSGSAKDADMRSISSRPPPLVPDVSSSESDESDGLAFPPEFANATSTSLRHYSHHSIPQTQEHLDKALAFLPHPPPSTKDRSKRRSSASVSIPRFKSEDGARSFAASSLDGCLGGF